MNNTLARHVMGWVLTCGALVCPAQQRGSEQRHFGAEDESFKRPFPLPESILILLTHDDMVKQSLDNTNIPPNRLPASWFQASEVHLAGPAEKDVVVMGVCPVCGANVAPFWVFRPKASGYEQIMFGGGLGLSVTKHRTNGYLDIETGSVSMQKPWTGVWRFDGNKYQLAPDKRKPNDQD